MKYVTEIILMTLIVGCLTAMIVILTNSCKNSNFTLNMKDENESSGPALLVLDNLGFFSNCGIDTIDVTSKGIFDAGIRAKNVIFGGHDVDVTSSKCATNIANMKKL